jgi:hypothetical protein
MKMLLPEKIGASLVSAEALYAAEQRDLDVFIHIEYTKDARRQVWQRHALMPQAYIEFATGKSYDAVKRWQQRGYIVPVRTIGTAALFDVAHVEHLLQTEDFAASDDDLCDEAWVAQAFWAWVPHDRLPAAPGSPAERIANMPFMRDFRRFVDERLAEVAKLRLADQAAIAKQAG